MPFAIMEIFQYLMLKLFTTPKLRREQERVESSGSIIQNDLIAEIIG